MSERFRRLFSSSGRIEAEKAKEASAKVYRAFLSGLWRELERRREEEKININKTTNSFRIPFVPFDHPSFLAPMLEKSQVDPEDDSCFISVVRRVDDGSTKERGNVFSLGFMRPVVGRGSVIFRSLPDKPEGENLVCRASGEGVAEGFNSESFVVRANRIQELVEAITKSIKDGALDN